MLLFKTKHLVKAIIIKRPSSTIKSPYVADINLIDDDNDIIDFNTYLAHCPSLGCCGLSDSNSIVYLSENNEKTKTKYTVELCLFNENKNNQIINQYISLKPKIAEYISFEILKNNLLFNYIEFKSIIKEKVFENSRFDFYAIDINDNEHIIEIKTAPLAFYVDLPKKEYNKYSNYINHCNVNDKISYFPDGYRKNVNEPISPRALKHIQELEKIHIEKNIICTLLFVIPRTDVKWFQPSNIDPIYKKAVAKAWLNGVNIKVVQIKWNDIGEGYFYSNTLPIHLFENYGPYRLSDIN